MRNINLLRNYFECGPVVKEMPFKDISIFSSGGMQSRMVSAILVDGIMKNISVI